MEQVAEANKVWATVALEGHQQSVKRPSGKRLMQEKARPYSRQGVCAFCKFMGWWYGWMGRVTYPRRRLWT